MTGWFAITASVGLEVVTKEVPVIEVNTLTPFLSGPQELTEGDSEVEFTFRLDGISDDQLTVVFTAEPNEVTIAPGSVTIAPGEREGSFHVSVEDDSILQGDRPFTLTATTTKTGESDMLSGIITDNDIAGFAFSMPEMIEADQYLNLLIKAVNTDGGIVRAFHGSASVYRIDPDSEAEVLLAEGISFSQGEATAAVAFPFSARGEVLVVRSDTDATEAASAPLVIFANLAFAANDILHDSQRDLLYTVSGGAAISGHHHSVTVIDPSSAEIIDALFIGGDPRNMVITDDGQYLYAGLWSAYAVQRVNLETFTVAERIKLDASGSWQGNSFTPYGLLAVPGRPLDFIAAQNHVSSTYRTTRLYSNGVVQPQDNRNAVELAPAGDANEFYAFNSASTGYDFMRLRLTSTGIETVDSTRLFSGFGIRIAAQDDLIFSNSGYVADGLKMEIIANLLFPAEWSGPTITMLPDTDRSRVYYARGNQIVAYDSGVFQIVAKITIPGIGNITRMTRWGDVGLAVLTDTSRVVLFEAGDLIPAGPATDLSVSITAAPDPVFLSEELEYTATIGNIGIEIARDTRLVIDLNEGQQLEGISAGTFPYSTHGRTVIIAIGDMEPGDSHQFSVTVKPTEITTLIGTAGALTRTLDQDYSNTRASVVLNVGFNSQAESVNVVKIPINDVKYEPVSGDLIVSVRSDAHSGIANHVLAIDPSSGLITRAIPVPSEPGLLALSSDGSTVYAVSGNIGFRVNLVTQSVVDTIMFYSTFGSDIPRSIVVVAGTVDKLVVGFDRRAFLYIDGVRKGGFNGDPDRIVALPEPNLFFAYNSTNTGFQSYLLEIEYEGLIATATAGLFNGFNLSIKSDGYFVYGSSGGGVRADLMTLDGAFSFSQAFSGSVGSLTAFAPDRAGQRIYYARNKEIASFDTDSYLFMHKVSFDQLPANISALERWGQDGFAARLQNNELAIIRTNLISQVPSAIDLIVHLPAGGEVGVPSLSITGSAFSGQGISGVTVNGLEAATVNQYIEWEAVVDGLLEGENLLTVVATSSGNPPANRSITRSIYYNPHLDSMGNGLADSWVVEHFGDLSSPFADPDLDLSGDGRTNLTAFLFGTNPLEAQGPHFVVRPLKDHDDKDLLVEIVHRKTGEWDFFLQSSVNLVAWSDFNGQLEYLGETEVDGKPQYVKTTYRLTPNTNNRGEFYRLRAEKRCD